MKSAGLDQLAGLLADHVDAQAPVHERLDHALGGVLAARPVQAEASPGLELGPSCSASQGGNYLLPHTLRGEGTSRYTPEGVTLRSRLTDVEQSRSAQPSRESTSVTPGGDSQVGKRRATLVGVPNGGTHMAGRLLDLLERTDYAFSGLGVSASTGEIPVAQNIDISQFSESTLLVRVHANALAGAQKLNVIVRSVLPAPDEPNVFYRDNTSTSTTIDVNIAAPRLVRLALPANLGAMISVFVQGVQGATGGQGHTSTISIALSTKD